MASGAESAGAVSYTIVVGLAESYLPSALWNTMIWIAALHLDFHTKQSIEAEDTWILYSKYFRNIRKIIIGFIKDFYHPSVVDLVELESEKGAIIVAAMIDASLLNQGEDIWPTTRVINYYPRRTFG